MRKQELTLFNSWDTHFKTPFGAVATDQEVVFRVHLSKILPQESVSLSVFPIDNPEDSQSIPMEFESSNLVTNQYRGRFSAPVPCILGYFFEVNASDTSVTIKKGRTSQGILGEGEAWQLTVYHKEMKVPKTFGSGIIYQIFPDRFCNSGQLKEGVPDDRILRHDWGGLPVWHPTAEGKVLNNDYFGGDLRGIEEKLDYLADLGVTMVYLNPIFESHTNHRYDTADYQKIDPLLGTEADFKRLCSRAQEKGIQIILDGVFNHSGSDSVYFNKEKRYGEGGAFNDPESPYYPWYFFKNYPDEYECWWGFPTLPNLDEEEESYQQYICGAAGVAEKWLRLGAAGYRLDVADELPDDFLDLFYARVKAVNPDAAVVGEVWEDASNKVSDGVRRRYLLGKQLDSVMNYPFMKAILSYIREGTGAQFYETVLGVLDNYPPPVIACLMNSISTHDTPRAITELAGKPLQQEGREWQDQHHYLPLAVYGKGKKLLTLATVLQFGLPGIPCVYYGDEAGLSGYRDPFNRVCYPWKHQDMEMVATVSVLGQLRKNYPALAWAPFVPLFFGKETGSFLRELETEVFYFGINRGENPQPLGYSIPKNAQCLFSSESSNRDRLAPFGAVIFRWDREQK